MFRTVLLLILCFTRVFSAHDAANTSKKNNLNMLQQAIKIKELRKIIMDYVGFDYILVGKINTQDGPVKALAFTPDGSKFFSAGTHGIRTFSNTQPLRLIKSTNKLATALACSPKGDYIVYGSKDGFIAKANVEFTCIEYIQGGFLPSVPSIVPLSFSLNDKGLSGLVFSPNGEYLFGRFGSYIRKWKFETSSIKDEIADSARLFQDSNIAVSPDGKYISTGGHAYTTHPLSYFRKSGRAGCFPRALASSLHHEMYVNLNISQAIQFDPSTQSHIVVHNSAPDESNTVKFSRFDSDEIETTISINSECTSLATTPDGSYVAVGGADGIISIFMLHKHE